MVRLVISESLSFTPVVAVGRLLLKAKTNRAKTLTEAATRIRNTTTINSLVIGFDPVVASSDNCELSPHAASISVWIAEPVWSLAQSILTAKSTDGTRQDPERPAVNAASAETDLVSAV